MPPLIGSLVTGGMATLHELQTVYSLRDAYELNEILTLKNYHGWLAAQKE